MKNEAEIRRELEVLKRQLASTDKALVEFRHELLGCIRQLHWALGEEEESSRIPKEWHAMSDKDHPTPGDYERALDAQSACNLSGIVHSFSDVLNRIWKEANETGKGTEFVNTHPISRLYAEQITHLSGAGMPEGGSNDYSKAHDICMEKSGRKETKPV